MVGIMSVNTGRRLRWLLRWKGWTVEHNRCPLPSHRWLCGRLFWNDHQSLVAEGKVE